MAWERSVKLNTLMIASAIGGVVTGGGLSIGAMTIRPAADGTLRDVGIGGVLDGEADTADWYFNASSFEGAITLSTANPATTLEDRVVWEYNLATVSYELPVFATLNFTIRGAPAYPRPNVDIYVYSYPADLAEKLTDFSAGPAVFQSAFTVPPYQSPTARSINVSGVVNEALASGLGKVAFRFQVDPLTPFTLNQAFIDALESEPTSKPFLKIHDTLPGDITGDDEVNLDDFAAFDECLSGPDGGIAAGCAPMDLNHDYVIDLRDVQLLQSDFSNNYQ